jgi:tetratricopeptide (TPR) repeat protein
MDHEPCYVRIVVACLVFTAGCGKDPAPPATSPAAPAAADVPSAETIAQHNRGVALMGRFEYAEAAKVFEKLVQERPDWHDARVDWAIAVLNRQEDGDTPRALDLLGQVVQARPDHLRARYCRGLLLSYEGKSDEARADFERVLAADPRDAYATYFLGQIAFSQSRFEKPKNFSPRPPKSIPTSAAPTTDWRKSSSAPASPTRRKNSSPSFNGWPTILSRASRNTNTCGWGRKPR